MVTTRFIYVFGGYGNNYFEIDQVERCLLTSGQEMFEDIEIENAGSLVGRDFCTFANPFLPKSHFLVFGNA